LGTAVVARLPQQLQRIRGPKDATRGVVGQSSMLPALMAAVLSGHERRAWRILPSVIGRIGPSSWPFDQLRTDKERNQVTVIGSQKGTFVALSD
jgi:hypothetical protein